MKKILLTLISVFFCLANGMAQRYHDYSFSEQMVITIQVDNGLPRTGNPQASQQVIRDSQMNILDFFLLQNLTIVGPTGNSLDLGEVKLEGVTITTGEDGLYHVSYDGTYTFSTSNMPIEIARQYGSSFTDVPVKLEGKYNSEGKLYAVFTARITMKTGSSTSRMLVMANIGEDNFPTTKIYTEPLVVTVDGVSCPSQDADIKVTDKKDGTIDFELKNLVLYIEDDMTAVGNIALSDVTVTEGEDGLKNLSYDGSVMITEGDIEGAEWIGPMLCDAYGAIPVVLNGKLNDDKLYVTIDIDMTNTPLNQMIYVEIGTDDFSAPVAITGDTNGDGTVDIADVVAILNAMAADKTDAQYDVNGDGDVDIADVVAVLNIMAQQ